MSPKSYLLRLLSLSRSFILITVVGVVSPVSIAVWMCYVDIITVSPPLLHGVSHITIVSIPIASTVAAIGVLSVWCDMGCLINLG